MPLPLPQLTPAAASLKIPVNEVFGPTIQGEGPDIGKPCFFLRLHLCPVQCPGCDTHYTWDGTETGVRMPMLELHDYLRKRLQEYPGAGLVVSGGEPLLYHQHEGLRELVSRFSRTTWAGLETSGFASKRPIPFYELDSFFRQFSTISWSPKITPCLHGKHSDEDLLVNAPNIIRLLRRRDLGPYGVIKMVVRDEADVQVVDDFVKHYEIERHGIPVHLMPYGLEAEEVAESCRRLVTTVARRGYTLSPRLHSLLWGKKRGV